MAASNSGGGAARQRAKNQAMAAYMAAHGVKRSTFRCPICNGMVALSRSYEHLAYHK